MLVLFQSGIEKNLNIYNDLVHPDFLQDLKLNNDIDSLKRQMNL